jgi:hypothetical protein
VHTNHWLETLDRLLACFKAVGTGACVIPEDLELGFLRGEGGDCSFDGERSFRSRWRKLSLPSVLGVEKAEVMALIAASALACFCCWESRSVEEVVGEKTCLTS